ncbi:alpha-hydroxy acid oxidase [Deinococcus gobiensis]|uniref:alpha-hydroxy acid oxidase n=1 Tax=Deinococcus gobiensis TaxID=502394 RepID=UPI0002FB6F96|nr:alpha-hydroxy acid oxidase [Deinococcus gobiensis]
MTGPGPDLSALLNLAEVEAAGRAALAQQPAALDYYVSGANDEHTLRANRADYARVRLRPRVLVDVSRTDLSTTVLGLPVSLPVGIAPSAMHGLAHPDGEAATARAVAGAGSLMGLSTMSWRPLEEVAGAAAGRLWFQLYLYRDRELSRDLVVRAEAAGARALVLTVDAPRLGRREPILRRPLHLPPGVTLPNVGARRPGTEHLSELAHFDSLLDTSLSWRDLDWLAGATRLPIVLKGILTAEDAALAVAHGAHVWVSNHGGRQLDTAVSALEALPEIADAVAGEREIYLDGGVTRGTDVLKALALGARAVFLGRAAFWGLALAGEAGVRHTLELLREELHLAMALCGKTRLDDLGPDLLRLPADWPAGRGQ